MSDVIGALFCDDDANKDKDTDASVVVADVKEKEAIVDDENDGDDEVVNEAATYREYVVPENFGKLLEALELPNQKHPVPLVETETLANVPLPDLDPKRFDADLVPVGLSGPQLVSVLHADRAHRQWLPAGHPDDVDDYQRSREANPLKKGWVRRHVREKRERRGYWIADGTGVGKGRQCAAIALMNMMQGRFLHIWLSPSRCLQNDLERDVRATGGRNVHVLDLRSVRSFQRHIRPLLDNALHMYNEDRERHRSPRPYGVIVFITYSLLAKNDRFDQLRDICRLYSEWESMSRVVYADAELSSSLVSAEVSGQVSESESESEEEDDASSDDDNDDSSGGDRGRGKSRSSRSSRSVELDSSDDDGYGLVPNSDDENFVVGDDVVEMASSNEDESLVSDDDDDDDDAARLLAAAAKKEDEDYRVPNVALARSPIRTRRSTRSVSKKTGQRLVFAEDGSGLVVVADDDDGEQGDDAPSAVESESNANQDNVMIDDDQEKQDELEKEEENDDDDEDEEIATLKAEREEKTRKRKAERREKRAQRKKRKRAQRKRRKRLRSRQVSVMNDDGDEKFDERQEGFSGVLVMDESHKAKALGLKGPQSKIAAKMFDLQSEFNGARLVYASATGACALDELSYMARLGLCGPGTAFKTFGAMFVALSQRGVDSTAMELVSIELKRMGLACTRTLGFHSTEFDVVQRNLSTEDELLYNQCVALWEYIIANFPPARPAKRYLWGAHQRFFLQLLLSLKVRHCVEECKAALATDHSVVISLISTGGTYLAKAAAGGGDDDDDEEDGDDSLFQSALKESINCTIEWWENNLIGGGAFDEAPKIVKQRAEELDLGPNPLDKLIDELGGPTMVAEITGRTLRQVRDLRTGVLETKRRSPSDTQLECRRFMDGAKRIAIISSAGSHGISLHADAGVKNQQRRVHIMLQLPWSATVALQQFGRTHRSNQVSSPIYTMIITPLGGEYRLASNIANQLRELGAVTSADRRASAQLSAIDTTFSLLPEWANKAIKLMSRTYGPTTLAPIGVTPNAPPPSAPASSSSSLEATLSASTPLQCADSLTRQMAFKSAKFSQFLNRLLGLTIDSQKEMFEKFIETYEATIADAKEAGTFDDGVRELFAVAQGEPEVWYNSTSGDDTYCLRLLTDRGVSWDRSHAMLKAHELRFPHSYNGYWRNRQSGNVALMLIKPMTTRDLQTFRRSGYCTRYFVQVRANLGRQTPINEHHLRSSWVRVNTEMAARNNWMQMYTASNHGERGGRQVSQYLLWGVLLPIFSLVSSCGAVPSVSRARCVETLDQVNERSLRKSTVCTQPPRSGLLIRDEEAARHLKIALAAAISERTRSEQTRRDALRAGPSNPMTGDVGGASAQQKLAGDVLASSLSPLDAALSAIIGAGGGMRALPLPAHARKKMRVASTRSSLSEAALPSQQRQKSALKASILSSSSSSSAAFMQGETCMFCFRQYAETLSACPHCHVPNRNASVAIKPDVGASDAPKRRAPTRARKKKEVEDWGMIDDDDDSDYGDESSVSANANAGRRRRGGAGGSARKEAIVIDDVDISDLIGGDDIIDLRRGSGRINVAPIIPFGDVAQRESRKRERGDDNNNDNDNNDNDGSPIAAARSSSSGGGVSPTSQSERRSPRVFVAFAGAAMQKREQALVFRLGGWFTSNIDAASMLLCDGDAPTPSWRLCVALTLGVPLVRRLDYLRACSDANRWLDVSAYTIDVVSTGGEGEPLPIAQPRSASARKMLAGMRFFVTPHTFMPRVGVAHVISAAGGALLERLADDVDRTALVLSSPSDVDALELLDQQGRDVYDMELLLRAVLRQDATLLSIASILEEHRLHAPKRRKFVSFERSLSLYNLTNR
jgi:C-terminal domain on Strawberry notch homologue/P-loop containing NTP hydrolase pore-1/BRCT domain, a BRCA1 C-terminus domain